eukprot:2021775-Amphidinium_carterae.1
MEALGVDVLSGVARRWLPSTTMSRGVSGATGGVPFAGEDTNPTRCKLLLLDMVACHVVRRRKEVAHMVVPPRVQVLQQLWGGGRHSHRRTHTHTNPLDFLINCLWGLPAAHTQLLTKFAEFSSEMVVIRGCVGCAHGVAKTQNA